MASATTTVPIDEQGRIVVPKGVRKTLGIDGEATEVDVEVTTRE